MGITVTMRKRGTSYQLDYFVEGKRLRPQFKSRAEALSKKFSIENEFSEAENAPQVNVENHGTGERKKIPDAMREYIAFKEERSKRKGTFNADKYNLRSFYKELFDLHVDYLDQVNLQALELIQAKWKRSKLTHSTVNRRMNSIRGFFSKCVDWKLIKENPCKGLDVLPVVEVKRELWTERDVETLKNALPVWAQNFFEFLYETGARPVEATDLLFKDIDWSRRMVTLISYKGPSVYKREVALSDKLFTRLLALQEARRRFPGSVDEKPVFVNTRGNKITSESFSKLLCKTRRSLGLSEHLVAYGLRHGFLTLLNKLGVSQQTIMKVAGHRKAETTARYIQHDDESLKNVVNLVEEARKRRV